MSSTQRLEMDSVLAKVRNDLCQSHEWKKLCEHATLAVRESLETKSDHLSSTKDADTMTAFIEQTILEALSGEEVYTTMHHKVADTLDLHFSERDSTSLLQASVSMLRKNPLLRSQLRVAFLNTPLPIPLRQALWGGLLQDHSIKDDFLLLYEGTPRKNSRLESQLLARCTSILEGKCLSEFKKYKRMSFELCAVLSFWKQKIKEELTTANCLLCIPFLYLFKEELCSTKDFNWPVLATVAEMFVSYMKILPLNMRDVHHNPQVCSISIIFKYFVVSTSTIDIF